MTATTTPSVDTAVVVLNWNNAPDTLACLESLRHSSVPVRSVVVDNGSSDGSAELIEASGLADLMVRTGANLGYSGGNNAGLRQALSSGADVLVVLNNDTITHPDMVATLLLQLPAGAAVSPRIVHHDAGDTGEAGETVWFAGGVVDRGWPRHLQPDELAAPTHGIRDTETLTGCCIAAHRDTWERVGLFDDRYFLIFEDSDWSMRARANGVQLSVCDDAVLEHRVSRSFATGAGSLLAGYYFARNGLRFHRTWQRRHLWRFVVLKVLRPCARSVYRRSERRAGLFLLIGAIDGLIGRTGRARPALERLAARLGSRRTIVRSSS